MPPEAEPPPEEGPFPDWRRNQWVLALGSFGIAFGFTLPFAYLPLIVRQFGVTGNVAPWVGAIVGGYFVVGFLLAPVWGQVADHFGRKPVVLRAGYGLGVGFLLLALAPDVRWFLALFVLMGAVDGFSPSAVTLVATNTPRAASGRAIALVQAATLAGATLGPATGAVVTNWVSHVQPFYWLSGALGLAGTWATHRLVTEVPQAREDARFRLHLWTDLKRLGAAPGLPVLFFVAGVFTLSFFGSASVASLYTLRLVGEHGSYAGWGVNVWMGLVPPALTVASALGVPVWGRLVDRFEPRRLLALALLLGVAFTLPLPLLANPAQLIVVRLLLGFGAVGIQPLYVSLTTAAAPPRMAARALAISTGVSMLGSGLAPMAAGVIDPWLGLRAYWLLNVALLVAALAWWLRSGLGWRFVTGGGYRRRS